MDRNLNSSDFSDFLCNEYRAGRPTSIHRDKNTLKLKTLVSTNLLPKWKYFFVPQTAPKTRKYKRSSLNFRSTRINISPFNEYLIFSAITISKEYTQEVLPRSRFKITATVKQYTSHTCRRHYFHSTSLETHLAAYIVSFPPETVYDSPWFTFILMLYHRSYRSGNLWYLK